MSWCGVYFGSVGIAALLLVLCRRRRRSWRAYGWSMDKLVFQPLRGVPTTAPLIAAIGLAMAMKDSVRLLQGPKTRYLLVERARRAWPIITGQGFDVYLSKGHLVVGLMHGGRSAAAALVAAARAPASGAASGPAPRTPRMAALLGVHDQPDDRPHLRARQRRWPALAGVFAGAAIRRRSTSTWAR